MAESIGSGNGSGPTSGYDIPAPNFVEQGKAQGQGWTESGAFDDWIHKYVLAHISGPGSILSGLGSMFDTLMTVFVEFVGNAQAKGTPGFFSLLSAVLGDLIGVEISADQVSGAWHRGGSKAAFKAVGAGYWNALLEQIGSPASLTPASGLAAAEGFLGYLLGFSIREGNIAMLASVIPEEWRFMDGINEYAEAMRSSLGLGRMARQALHPLIQTLITDPLQWYVNQQYQPKLLGEGAATRAYNRGLIDNGAWYEEMSYAGYNPARSAALQAEYLAHLSAADIQTLREQGTVNDQQAVDALKNSSYDPTTAAQLLAVFDANSMRTYVSQQIATLRTQRLNGGLDDAGFASEVDKLSIGAAAQAAVKQAMASEMLFPRKTLAWTEAHEASDAGLLSLNDAAVFLAQQGYSQRDAGILLQIPRAKLTLAEVQSAFVEGLLDSTDVSTWLRTAGYQDADAQVLWLQTLLKLGTEEAKIAVAKYKQDKAVAAAQKKGEAPPPPPPILAQGPT